MEKERRQPTIVGVKNSRNCPFIGIKILATGSSILLQNTRVTDRRVDRMLTAKTELAMLRSVTTVNIIYLYIWGSYHIKYDIRASKDTTANKVYIIIRIQYNFALWISCFIACCLKDYCSLCNSGWRNFQYGNLSTFSVVNLTVKFEGVPRLELKLGWGGFQLPLMCYIS